MEIPEGYRFSEEHEWAREEEDGSITIGISWHAQDLLGDIVYVELPEEGDSIESGEEFGVLESVKAASDLYAPISGEVIVVNMELEDAPQTINESPFDEGWMMRVRPDDIQEFNDLMDADEYRAFVERG
ncbi:glycine cleavage system protein GcvH [Bradymonas sediminis]|uniref:Glycine cleavage system H protein n=1 Tax=Bradymonas sediminis TaxID=1548548 RepID=A0A2Z4FKD2_9DELT|nr:glycine cleavage system protein GcvH [Bradymonas sediminis]AWV89340.1 glycine cleavage system protein GcvH [Bradymonas sediminis]TDP73516.1 glycine cleavage system H protein [Bradymonas sediminis]